MTALRRVLIASSVVWALLLPLAPFAASQPAPARVWYALAFVVYGAGSVLCHQLPERSFVLWSAQLPVCARCAGIYLGAAVAAVIASGFSGTTAASGVAVLGPRSILAVAALPSAMTLIYEWTSGDTPSNVIRALAGAPLGAAIVFVVVRALREAPAGRTPSGPPNVN